MSQEPSDELARTTGPWLWASALAPLLVAASHVGLHCRGDRDAGVVRAVGLGYAGGFRALDAWLAAPFAALPLGTRALRAALPGTLLLAATAALLFTLLSRRLVSTAGPGPAPSRWAPVVACVATLTVTCALPLQQEATTPASGLAGVVLVLVTLVLAEGPSPSLPLFAGLSTLALSYEPAVGAAVAVAAIVGLFARGGSPATSAGAGSPREPARRSGATLLAIETLLAVALGLLPFGLSILHARVTPLSTGARTLAWPGGEGLLAPPTPLPSSMRQALAFARAELGDALLLLAAAGFVWALATSRRRRALPLAAVTATACLAFAAAARGAGEPLGTMGLLSVVGIVGFAGVAMHEVVIRVSRAKLPLASASAAMVVVLFAAFPAVMLDDGLARVSGLLALPAWEDAAFAGLPSGTIVLVSAPRLYARLLATLATGDLPGDIVLLPTFDPSNEAALVALARDAHLVPLFRDMVLTGAPAELSMSNLAAARPLAVASDPGWDRTLSRHLIPTGLFARFEPEPRGGADRKRALDATAPHRAWLARALGITGNTGASVHGTDSPLAALAASMLFDRALSAAETGEREVALLAVGDAAVFSPRDPRLERLTVAVTRAKGPIDARDWMREGKTGRSVAGARQSP